MRRYWPYLFLSVSIFLVGCTRTVSSEPNIVVGDTSDTCKHLLHQQQLAEKLRSDGIQVVQVGEEVTLVMATNMFFYPNSNNMSFDSKVMKDIIDFINTYPTVNIQVTSYPNKVGNAVRNFALSRSQAEAIAHYLWENGLDTRLISADAKRGLCEVPRIEIFFRLPSPKNVFH
jgi:intracellular multiplication protein IcmN